MKTQDDVARECNLANHGWYGRVKRCLDLFLAIVSAIVLGPAMLIIALAIRLDSPGAAIYRQKRVGACGRLFIIYKFRTMKTGTPTMATADMQHRASIPFTRLGPLLRKISLDELPQIFNIIRGDMSFVGPRPALPSQEDVNSLRKQFGVDSLRPGITGLAQVMGRDELDAETKVGYDCDYCKRLSLWNDLKIVWLTIGAVMSARGNK